MAKTDKEKFLKYNGYKFFKYNEDTDSLEIVRIVGMKDFNEKFKVKDESTGKVKTMPYEVLKQKYTPLQPRGFIMFINVWIDTASGKKSDDVIVAAYDMNHLKVFNDNIPYVVCRQSINDIFYDVIRADENKEMVGCCISKDTIPTNFMMSELLTCSGVYNSQIVNYYIDDTIESVLECLEVEQFDNMLENLFKEHMILKNRNNPLFDFSSCNILQNDGWCRNLSTLLHENNFITDFDIMRNIQALDFDLSEFIISPPQHEDTELEGKTDQPDHLSKEVVVWLSRTYRIPIKNALIIRYDYDIDLAEFDNTVYMLFRDSTNTTYIVVYVCEGEFLEAELEEKYKEISPSDKIRLAFYNKYQGLPGESYKDIIKN